MSSSERRSLDNEERSRTLRRKNELLLKIRNEYQDISKRKEKKRPPYKPLRKI